MTTNRPSASISALDLVAGRRDWRLLLERDYQAVAGRLASAYDRILPELRARSKTLIAEMARIERETGAPASASLVRGLDAYGALIERIEVETQDFAVLARFAASDLADRGAALGVEAALDAVASQSSIAANVWMRPDPEALARLVDYADGAAMRAKFAAFGANAGQDFADLMLSLTAQGKNARAIARAVEGWLNVPFAWAENMTRTVQNYSYRGATSAAYKANGRLLDGWLWRAALDERTCMSCVSQHGSLHSVDEALNDHHRGRCAMVPVVKGSTWPGDVESGEAWYERQPVGAQRRLAGDTLWVALKKGEAVWSDLSKAYDDDVFGTMLRAASVKDLVSDNRYQIVRGLAAQLPTNGASA